MTDVSNPPRGDSPANAGRSRQWPGAKRLRWCAFACGLASTLATGAAPGWMPDHTVIVVLENKSARQIEGNGQAPYLNALARGGALMVRAEFARTPYGTIPAGARSPLPARPSQPNYLYLFSGDDQGILPEWFHAEGSPYLGTAIYDARGNMLDRPLTRAPVGIGNRMVPPSMRPFTTPNLGAAVIAAGGTFGSFCESLPYPHYDGAVDAGGSAAAPDRYRRKHNPAINWINLAGKPLPADKARFVLPVSANLGFTRTHDPVDGKDYRGFAEDAKGIAIGYEQLPTVSIVVPNDQHNAHSGSIAAADTWLRVHIKPYADWARTHNSLLVVTFDEDAAADASRGDPLRTGHDTIFTVFYGPVDRVVPGRYAQRIDHLNVLATVLDRHGLLERFRTDFLAAHGPGAQTRAELANLVPVRDIFGD